MVLNLPESLGTLSDGDLARIDANHGSPYTEDFNQVFTPLQPHVVQANLVEFARDSLRPLADIVQQERCPPRVPKMLHPAHPLM